MRFDTVEQNALSVEQVNLGLKLKGLNSSFETKLQPKNGYYENINPSIDNNIASWLNEGDSAIVAPVRASSLNAIKQMFSGTEINGHKTLGLNEINKWNVNPDYKYANLKQHAGYSAEVISTTKENIIATAKGTGITTYRTDDLPEIYGKNNQYIDKVRVDSNGNVVERVQTKFVGKDASGCLSKLASSKYSKYLNDGQVDKIEIASDYYDEIKNELIPNKISKLEEQVKRNTELGKDDVVAQKTAEIEKYKKIDSMIEKSLVSTDEAMNATKHPKIYSAKLFAKSTVNAGHEVGVSSAKSAAGITACISTVDNVSKVYNGELEVEDAVVNIVYDTGSAVALGYGTGFVSGAVSSAMKNSSHQLLRSVGGSCLPAATVSLAIESYDVISDYSAGKIDEYELAEGLGDSAAKVAGSTAGAAIGGAVGSVVPGVGTAAGAIVGGMVGCAVASEAYQSTVEFVKENADEVVEVVEEVAEKVVETGEVVVETVVEGTKVVVEKTQEVAQNVVEGVEKLAEQAQEFASDTIETVKEVMPEKLPDVKAAFNDFANKCNMSFNI